MSRSLAVLALLVATGVASRAEAAPDPTLASLLSAGSTVVPLTVTAGLWLSGPGTNEGIRFDIGMTCLGLGAVLGPSIGQIYGQGGTDAWVSFILRAITGGVMMAGVGMAARGDEPAKGAGRALAAVGGIPTGLLAIWDILGARKSAIEAAQRTGHGPSITLPPLDIGGFSLACSLIEGPC